MNEHNTTHKINIMSQKDNHYDSTYIKGKKGKDCLLFRNSYACANLK